MAKEDKKSDNSNLKLWAPIVISLLFHLHRFGNLNIISNNTISIVEPVLFAVIAGIVYYQEFSDKDSKSKQKGGGDEGEGKEEGGKKDGEKGDGDKEGKTKEYAAVGLPLSNVLSSLMFDHLSSSNSRSRRQRGGKKRSRSSRRSRSKSRRRRRSKKN